jgi:hypothetical protein
MNENEMIILGVIVVMLIGVAAAIYLNQRHRSRQLQAHFGPEYNHAIEGFGERRAAERALVDRTRRVDKLAIHSLPALRRGELSSRWQAVQAEFVDDPASAVRDAHELLDTVMREQGYPTGKFEDEVELLSVHHPATVQHYRAAHRLAEDREHGNSATEDLRQAMIHYRALFDDLLNAGVPREPHRRLEVRHEA